MCVCPYALPIYVCFWGDFFGLNITYIPQSVEERSKIDAIRKISEVFWLGVGNWCAGRRVSLGGNGGGNVTVQSQRSVQIKLFLKHLNLCLEVTFATTFD